MFARPCIASHRPPFPNLARHVRHNGARETRYLAETGTLAKVGGDGLAGRGKTTLLSRSTVFQDMVEHAMH